MTKPRKRPNYIWVVRFINDKGMVDYIRNTMGTPLNHCSMKNAKMAAAQSIAEGENRKDIQAVKTTRDEL